MGHCDRQNYKKMRIDVKEFVFGEKRVKNFQRKSLSVDDRKTVGIE